MDFCKNIGQNIEVDGYGDIEILTQGGYHGELIDRTFSIPELMDIVEQATQFKLDYDAYVANDYEDIV